MTATSKENRAQNAAVDQVRTALIGLVFIGTYRQVRHLLVSMLVMETSHCLVMIP